MKRIKMLILAILLCSSCVASVPDGCQYIITCDFQTNGCEYLNFLSYRDLDNQEFRSERWASDGNSQIRQLEVGYRFGEETRRSFTAVAALMESAWFQTTNKVMTIKATNDLSKICQVYLFNRRRNGSICRDFDLTTNCPCSVVSHREADGVQKLRSVFFFQDQPEWGKVFFSQKVVDPKRPRPARFADIYFTPLRLLGCSVRCRGKLRNVSENTADLYCDWASEDDPACTDQFSIVRVCNRCFVIGLEFDPKSQDCGKLKELEGHVVQIRGEVSVRGFNGYLDWFLAWLKDCQIEEASSQATIAQPDPIFRYSSPCREFKLIVQSDVQSYYTVHCSSSLLRLYHWGKNVQNKELPRVISLIGHRDKEKSMREVWSCLRELEDLLARQYGKDCHFDGKLCSARRFAEIKEFRVTRKEYPKLAAVVSNLSDRVETVCSTFSLEEE